MGGFEIIGESLRDAATSWTSSNGSHMSGVTRLTSNDTPEIDYNGSDGCGGHHASTKNGAAHNEEAAHEQHAIRERRGSVGRVNDAVSFAGDIGGGTLRRKERRWEQPYLMARLLELSWAPQKV